jgi:hypothetical protein
MDIRAEDITPQMREKFWSLINKTDNPKECWEWKWPLSSGYGRLHLRTQKGHKFVLAHRISWLLRYGTLPQDLCVCHSCDNRLCVNINHLWLGTKGHNSEDMWRKGRRANVKTGPPKGTKIPESVKEKIRAAWTPERRKAHSKSSSERLRKLWAKAKEVRASQQDGHMAKGNPLRGHKLTKQ